MRILFKYTTDDDWVHQIRATNGVDISSVHIDSDETMVIMENGEMYVFETRGGDVEWDDLDENPGFEEEEDLTLEQVVEFLNDYECKTSMEEVYKTGAITWLDTILQGRKKSGVPFPPRHEGGFITYTNEANSTMGKVTFTGHGDELLRDIKAKYPNGT